MEVLYHQSKYSLLDKEKVGLFTHVISSKKLLHSHDFWECFYLVRGSCTHFVNNNKVQIARKSLFLLKPEIVHSLDDNKYEESTIHRDICISDEHMRNVCGFLSPTMYDTLKNSRAPISVQLSDETENFLEKSLNSFNLIDNVEDKRKLASVITSIVLAQVIESNHIIDDKHPDWFNKLLIHLQSMEVLKEGISALIRLSGYSHGHLSRMFRQQTDKTLNQVLTEYRMNLAASLLRHTDRSLLYIAGELGYESISQFTSQFKKQYNMAPGQYRNSSSTFKMEMAPNN